MRRLLPVLVLALLVAPLVDGASDGIRDGPALTVGSCEGGIDGCDDVDGLSVGIWLGISDRSTHVKLLALMSTYESNIRSATSATTILILFHCPSIGCPFAISFVVNPSASISGYVTPVSLTSLP